MRQIEKNLGICGYIPVRPVSLLRWFALLALMISILDCSTGPQLSGEGALVVNTPVYRANRVFYMEPREIRDADGTVRLYYDLLDPVIESRSPRNKLAEEVVNKSKPVTATEPAENSEPVVVAEPVENGEPVTVIINKAYIPIDAAGGKLDKTRDIAVLLDLGLQPGKHEFIAVWYQRDVPANEELSFSSLPVYSLDAWNADAPPRFRVRLVDVSAERNKRTAELLSLASQVSGPVVSLIGTPAAGVGVEIASQAARLVLANNSNVNLVDYEFYFFSESQLAEAGGAPIALFRKGAMVVMGRPKNADESFWDQKLQYDHNRKRLQVFDPNGPGESVASPYVLASVLTAETLISNLVKQRSAYITKILTDSAPAVQADIAGLTKNAKDLLTSLQVLEIRQKFRNFPSEGGFSKFLNEAKTNWDALPSSDQDFLLFSIKNSTDIIRGDAGEYYDWWTKCKNYYEVDAKTKRIVEKKNDGTPKECK
jgi:hypothetical protein